MKETQNTLNKYSSSAISRNLVYGIESIMLQMKESHKTLNEYSTSASSRKIIYGIQSIIL